MNHARYFNEQGTLNDVRYAQNLFALWVQVHLFPDHEPQEKEQGEPPLVLDVGAADGFLGNYFEKYCGIDIAPKSSKVQNTNFFNLQIAHPFHAIIYCHVLEHLENPQSFLNRSFDILDTGGRIFIAVPVGEWAWEIDSHINLYNETILKRNLTCAGFTVEQVVHISTRKNCEELWICGIKHLS